MTDETIRPLRRDDLAAAEALIGAVDLFPPEMLAEMAAPYLEGADELWLVVEGARALLTPRPSG